MKELYEKGLAATVLGNDMSGLVDRLDSTRRAHEQFVNLDSRIKES